MRAPKKIALVAIRVDGGTQMREKLPEHRVDEYAEALEAGEVFPAAVVFFDGSNYWMADGFTRYFAHKKAGRKEILCDVREGTRHDAFVYALGANSKHGEPRTNADKRKAVAMALGDAALAGKSDPEIAAICAVSRGLVQVVRREREGRALPPSKQGGATQASARAEPAEACDSEPDADESSTDTDRDAESVPEGDSPAEPVMSQPAGERAEETTAPARKQEVVRDGLGIAITDPKMLEVFKILESSRPAHKCLVDARAAINLLCQAPGGEHLALEIGARVTKGETSYRSHHVQQAIQQLDNHLPFLSVCPYCHLGIKSEFTGGKKCGACRDLGYITKQQWKQCSEEIQAKIRKDFGVEDAK